MEERSPYLIGIDLGTTNIAVSYCETDANKNPSLAIHQFRIPQVVDPGVVKALPLLPACSYRLSENEFTQEQLALPWDKSKRQWIIGQFAKLQGSLIPTRLVSSAKSWLAHSAAFRREKILPVEADDLEKRLSPVEASSLYLKYIQEAWDAYIAKGDPAKTFLQQEIVLTVPASFDDMARALTIEAAQGVGLKRLTLLEEPQAAFYHWLGEHEQEVQQIFQQDDSILICDVGGGTTDFTWITVEKTTEGLSFQRTAVGRHLLLGGDNMDAALRHVLEMQLPENLTTIQQLQLHQQARIAKESLLTKNKLPSFTAFLAGSGSSIVAKSHSATITQEDARKVLIDGFFGIYPFEEAIKLRPGTGVRSIGLPFEAEPSITKQLATFLHRNALKMRPTHLLFNGGAFTPKMFRERVITSVENWFPSEKPIQVLSTNNLDVAVSRGAVYFAKVRQGWGVKIEGGSSRGYYLAIDVNGKEKGLTLLPRGTKEGMRYISDLSFSLLPNIPVKFQLYYSQTRLGDEKGVIVDLHEEEMTPYPPLQTVLKYGTKQQDPLPVKVGIYLTEIGTLELWIETLNLSHRWNLAFQLRTEKNEEALLTPSSNSFETISQEKIEQAQNILNDAFSSGRQEMLHALLPNIENAIDLPKLQWPLGLLRKLFDILLHHASKRQISTFYDTRFWNLAGYFLRPGVGFPLDDFRMKQMWKCCLEDMNKPKQEEALIQQWICYRRMAAGFSTGQQEQLFKGLISNLLSKSSKNSYAYMEKVRALASFESVDPQLKIKLGNLLLQRLKDKKGTAADFWALGRLGTRQLLWGAAGNCIPRTIVEEWVEVLLQLRGVEGQHVGFALALLARKGDVKELNLSENYLRKIDALIKTLPDSTEWISIRDAQLLSAQEKNKLFGDHLPLGLSISPRA